MYAAHFATALAIGSRARQAPTWALLGGAFLPDIIWISLTALGIEPATQSIFFDDWSHSFVSVTVLASLFALCFMHRGARVWVPVWTAVASHFVLDAIVHPKPLALYPRSRVHCPGICGNGVRYVLPLDSRITGFYSSALWFRFYLFTQQERGAMISHAI